MKYRFWHRRMCVKNWRVATNEIDIISDHFLSLYHQIVSQMFSISVNTFFSTNGSSTQKRIQCNARYLSVIIKRMIFFIELNQTKTAPDSCATIILYHCTYQHHRCVFIMIMRTYTVKKNVKMMRTITNRTQHYSFWVKSG